jgi:tetratricopeptide (TPR) repeat protein
MLPDSIYVRLCSLDFFTEASRPGRAVAQWKAAALLAFLTLAAYAPILRNGFIWDDDSHITASALNVEPGGFARIWTTADAMQYYPLTFSAFRLEHLLWGFEPLGYHLLSLALHLASALLLAALLRRLRVPGAWWAAALFALHPTQVESVAWATELKNMMCMLFALLATERWVAYGESRSRRDYLLSLAAYAACLLSKTAAVLLPAVFLVLDWARGRRLGLRDAARLAPFFGLGGAMSVVTVLYERYRNGSDPEFVLHGLQRPVLAGQALWFYAWKLAAPFRLSFIYPRWTVDPSNPIQWLPLAAAAALAIFLWRARGRLGRAPAAAAAVYFLFLFPVLSFFDVFFMRFSYVADHFQYFAGVGLLALVPAAVERALKSPAARRAALSFLVLGSGTLTFARVPAFRDSEALWRDTLAHNPGAWMAWDNLAVEEMAHGRWAEAADDAGRAVALLPPYGLGWFHLGIAQWNQGDHARAAGSFARSLQIAPRYLASNKPRAAMAQSYLGIREAELGRASAAVERFQRATELAPDQAFCWFNLARALSGLGRRAEAADSCRRGLALAPDSPAGDVCRAKK